MIQTIFSSEKSLTLHSSGRLLCCYTNVTCHIEIIRIKNISELHLERVIFPGERLMFEAVPAAQLEIQSNQTLSVVPCHQLRVTEATAVNPLMKS